MKVRANIFLALCTFLMWPARLCAQGTITFDGPPPQPPGTAALMQLYDEGGLWFVPILGTDGFVRRGEETPFIRRTSPLIFKRLLVIR